MPDDTKTQWLTFHVGNECFAIHVKHICELYNRQPVTAVLGASDYIEGMLFHRGTPLCVLNAAKRLNIETDQASNLFIVMDSEQTTFALAVDSVGEVCTFPPDSHQDAFSGYDRAVSGIRITANGMVTTLNPEYLLEDNDRLTKEKRPC